MTDRRFACIHARRCMFQLARYLRAGVPADDLDELFADIRIAVDTYDLRALELLGGEA